MTETEIIDLIKADPFMMEVLSVAEKLNLPGWMIGAGFIRNKVWDHLHGFDRPEVLTNDIDLIYFDLENPHKEIDEEISLNLNLNNNLKWEVSNQARMHARNNHQPYKDTVEGMSFWPETATATAVTLKEGKLVLVAPYGLDDLTNLILRPTPSHRNKLAIFNRRITTKKWLIKWPKLRVVIDRN